MDFSSLNRIPQRAMTNNDPFWINLTPMLKKTTTPLLCLLFVLVTGCSNPQTSTDPKNTHKAQKSEIAQLIGQAQHLPSPSSERLLLKAVALLRKNNDFNRAERILSSIKISVLPADLKALAITETAQVALINQDTDLAVSILTTDRMGLITISNQLSTEQLNAISLLRATAWEQSGKFLASATERVFVSPMLSKDEYQENQKKIWANLTQISVESLEPLSLSANIPETKGWLELALLYKAYQNDLDKQIQRLRAWQTQYPNHPAAQQLPESLAILTQLIQQRPSNIALLLPEQGPYRPAAEAIRNGFMAAHYAQTKENTDSQNTAPITLKIYDSSNTQTFIETYQRAIAEGAELIIGPLQKNNVKALQQLEYSLPVPTIALNYVAPDKSNLSEGFTPTPPLNLYQFGLSPDDEARQVAQYAYQHEFNNAATLFPENAWGHRVINAFNKEWQNLEGNAYASSSFSKEKNYSVAIEEMLLLQQSHHRARQLANTLGNKPEFEPRRRQDIDFVFVLASAQQARQIKPLLDFHYAADLPVYATSQIYEGKPNPNLDNDINGIQFCDMPWVLEENNSTKEQITKTWPKSAAQFHRLNALGVDAYQLTSRIHMLANVPNAQFFGVTGTLSLTPNNLIKRKLSWAQIINGSPELMQPITTEINVKELNSANPWK